MTEKPDSESERELDREIEIRDPDSTLAGPGGTGGASPEDTESESKGPYSKGLLVPLIVVPAMIVMVAVLIAVLFGLLSGTASTPRENLDRLLTGGVNERTQAAFELVRQMLEYQTAQAEGRNPEWEIDESFLTDLHNARDGMGSPETSAEVWVPFVLSSLMAQLGDVGGVTQLLDMTRLGDALDPEYTFGQNAVFILGSIGSELDEPTRILVAERMIGLLADEDEGVVLLATAALQNLPSSGTSEALRGLLGSRRLDHRIQAAISLAELGEASGGDVLLRAVEEAPYTAEREEYPHRWAPQTVSETRRKVLAALFELGTPPSGAVLDRLVDSDSDPNVRSAALELRSRVQD